MRTAVWNGTCQSDGDVHSAGEVLQRKFTLYIVLHPAQLLRHVSSPQEAEQGVRLLALSDEFQGLLDALHQIIQWAADCWVIHHRRLVEQAQESAHSGHAPLDVSALLLVPASRLRRRLDRQPGSDDLLHATQCSIRHLALNFLPGDQIQGKDVSGETENLPVLFSHTIESRKLLSNLTSTDLDELFGW